MNEQSQDSEDAANLARSIRLDTVLPRSPEVAVSAPGRPMKVRTTAGTSTRASGAPFADAFRSWWGKGEHPWKYQQQMAAEVGISPVSLCSYFAGRKFPAEDHCQKLFEVTKLECFGPNRRLARALHSQSRKLQLPWARSLLARLHEFISTTTSSIRTGAQLRASTLAILIAAERAGMTGATEISPGWLGGLPLPELRRKRRRHASPEKRASRVAWVRNFFGLFLVQLRVWPESELTLLSANLASFIKRWAPASDHNPKAAWRTRSRTPPKQLRDLVFKLAQRCGLSTGELRALRATGIEPLGLNLSATPARIQRRKGKQPKRPHTKPARWIPFGDGPDEIPRALVEAYVATEHPTDFLFFCRAPRDKRKPINSTTLWRAAALPEPGSTITSLCRQHFRQDFNRFSNLRALRFHFRTVHGLSYSHVYELICGRQGKGFVAKAKSFPVPQPFFVVAICASGVLPNSPVVRPEANKRSRVEWPKLLGRYSITVDLPTVLAQKLQGPGHFRARALRVLFRAAWDQWYSGRRLRPAKIGIATRKDRDLLESFEKTSARVVDATTGAVWEGALFEFRNRKRTSYVPLIEVMNGAAWRSRCKVCMRPDRHAIDDEIRCALQIVAPRKSFKQIATARKVSYASLMWHAGMRRSVPGRGEDPRTHLGSAITAPVVQCPRSVAERANQLSVDALTVVPFLFSAEPPSQQSEVIVSASAIEKDFGISLNDNRLSLALADLRNHGVISDFGGVGGNFRIVMPNPNQI